jgi:site-specific DNA recombinase
MTLRHAEAAEVRQATKGVIEGRSLGSLVRDLNERGILTSQGNTWTIMKLRTVLMRPRNAGILVYRGKESGTAAWPPIVDELTWRQMRAILADPARRTSQSNRVSSLGSGLYLCGICSAPMKISTSGQGAKVRGYRCSDHNHLTQAAAPLDEYVTRRLSAILAHPGFIDSIVRGMQEPAGAVDGDRIKAANARLAELGEMFAAGDIDARTLKAGTEKLRAQIAEAEGALVKGAIPWSATLTLLQWVQQHPDDAWGLWELDTQRSVLAAMATITIMPATVRGGRFDAGRVKIEWTPEFRKYATPARLVPVKLKDGTTGYVVPQNVCPE